MRGLRRLYAEQCARTASLLDEVPGLCRAYAVVQTRALVGVVRQQQAQLASQRARLSQVIAALQEAHKAQNTLKTAASAKYTNILAEAQTIRPELTRIRADLTNQQKAAEKQLEKAAYLVNSLAKSATSPLCEECSRNRVAARRTELQCALAEKNAQTARQNAAACLRLEAQFASQLSTHVAFAVRRTDERLAGLEKKWEVLDRTIESVHSAALRASLCRNLDF